MKSKGFTLGPAAPPLGRLGGVLDGGEGGGSDVLYLPTGTDKVSQAFCVAPRHHKNVNGFLSNIPMGRQLPCAPTS